MNTEDKINALKEHLHTISSLYSEMSKEVEKFNALAKDVGAPAICESDVDWHYLAYRANVGLEMQSKRVMIWVPSSAIC